MVDQHVAHGWHQQHVGDTPALHCLKHTFRRKTGNEIVAAGDLRAGEHRRAVSNMEHRRRMQPTRILPQAQGRHGVEGVENQVAVAQHNALGAPGGAARVEQSSEVIIATTRVCHGLRCLQDLLKGQHALGRSSVADIDHMLNARDVARGLETGGNSGEGIVD